MKKEKPNPERIEPKSNHPHNKEKTPGKLITMLKAFAGGQKLHRFQAERLGDHCLHTTVSDLQIKHQITFSREWTKVPNRFRSITHVKNYWLDGENLERARVILGISKEVA